MTLNFTEQIIGTLEMPSNHLYICSTLRHLMFAIAKSSCEPEKKSYIIFFSDYQDVDTSRFSPEHLPSHVNVIFCTRKELTGHLEKNLKGRIIRLLSLWTFPFTKLIHSELSLSLQQLFKIDQSFFSDFKLFIFNDRNRTARTFRLLTNNYDVIEDGIGNYYQLPILHNWKKLGRFLLGKTPNFWLIGEDARCEHIHVIFPENLPKEIKEKGIAFTSIKDKNAVDHINNFFNFKPKLKENCVILATQPITKDILSKMTDPQHAYNMHYRIAKHFDDNNINVMIKLHPSEESDPYLDFFSEEQFLETKYPLELEIINSRNKVIIASLYSSAGLGFENFCQRKRLINDDEMDKFQDYILHWEQYPADLENKIKATF